jgi:hypothetical protein
LPRSLGLTLGWAGRNGKRATGGGLAILKRRKQTVGLWAAILQRTHRNPSVSFPMMRCSIGVPARPRSDPRSPAPRSPVRWCGLAYRDHHGQLSASTTRSCFLCNAPAETATKIGPDSTARLECTGDRDNQQAILDRSYMSPTVHSRPLSGARKRR